MKKTIAYCVRHSEQLKIDGIKNIEEDEQISNEKIILSVNGEIKAKELSELQELSNIDIIWSSNYVRAIATAKYIAQKNGLPINIDSNFNERKLGNVAELEELEKNKKYPYTEEQLLDENLKNIGGESRNEVNKRMTETLNRILKNNKEKRIVIVSHGAAIKFLLMNWCKLNEKNEIIYKNNINIDVKSPCVIRLEFKEEELENMNLIE